MTFDLFSEKNKLKKLLRFVSRTNLQHTEECFLGKDASIQRGCSWKS
jgi:hypothetical protein